MDKVIGIKPRGVNLFRDGWIWKLAWKDAVRHWSRLLFFVASVVIGIASLVSLTSFNHNLQLDIDNQAKALLGADLVLYADEPFAPELDSALFDSLPNEQASDVRFNTMAIFSSTGGSRMVQVVAVEGDYPFYGEMLTEPSYALNHFRQLDYALLDDHLAFEYSVSTGDTITLGKLKIRVAGIVTKIPGNVKATTTFAPSVYIPQAAVEATGLMKKGSRFNYRRYFRTLPDEQAESLLTRLKPAINKYGYGYETVAYRKESLGSGLENLYRFLNLLGFIALILGSVGVASSVHVYANEKRDMVALIRCLGAPARAAFYVFFIQIVSLGILGSVLGVAVGTLLQQVIPLVLSEFLPLKLSFSIAWPPVVEGLVLGVIVTVMFSAFALIHLRYISPMAILRPVYSLPVRSLWTKFKFLVGVLFFNWVFAVYQMRSKELGTYFFIGLIVAGLVLFVVGGLLVWLLRHAVPPWAGFVWRQSMANLSRPKNQTTVLIIVIGLGAFLIATVSLVRNGVLEQVREMGTKTRSNLVLFDIQPDQRAPIMEQLKGFRIEMQQEIPVVTMRINRIRGKTLSEIRAETDFNVPNWLLYMEHLCTYRDSLIESEEIVEGAFQAQADPKKDSVLVSITETIAEQLQLHVGDEIVFNLHGIAVPAYIGSVRKVDWQRIQTNFAFVFPVGVLEKAPQFYATLLHSPSKETTAKLKQELILRYSNVSTVDLTLVLKTIDDLIDRIAFAIHFMAFFSILTGLMVLAGSVVNSRFAKIRENTLLRTLGAARWQISLVGILEYAYIGFLAAATGVGLSLFAIEWLTQYFLEISFDHDWGNLAGVVGFITGLTVLVSWLNLRTLLNRPPLEVLREENG